MKIANHSLSFNERMLMELVFRGSATSRPEFAEKTGLTSATITRLVSSIMDKGLVSETAERNGSMGQPVRKISLVPGQAYSVGVNFMRGRFDIALIDLTGDIIKLERHEVSDITPNNIAELTAEKLTALLKVTRVSRDRLIGAGFSVPGNFAHDGVTLRAHDYFEALNGVDLRPILEQELGLFCAIETDGACAAVGEFLHGRGRKLKTFFFIHIGHGLGGGMVIDGNLYRGQHGNSSKPGALFPYDQPRPSGQDLVETLQRAGASVADITDLDSFDESYTEVLEGWLDRASRQLADVVRVATAFVDPELVILGGRLPKHLNSELVKRVLSIELPGPSRGLPNAGIVPSSLGPRTGALGAASIPIFEGFFTGSARSRGNNYVDGRRLT